MIPALLMVSSVFRIDSCTMYCCISATEQLAAPLSSVRIDRTGFCVLCWLRFCTSL